MSIVGYYNNNDDVLYNMCNNKVHDAIYVIYDMIT
jgi:hypothetical protein